MQINLFIYIASPEQDTEALRDTQWQGIEFNRCDMLSLVIKSIPQ